MRRRPDIAASNDDAPLFTLDQSSGGGGTGPTGGLGGNTVYPTMLDPPSSRSRGEQKQMQHHGSMQARRVSALTDRVGRLAHLLWRCCTFHDLCRKGVHLYLQQAAQQ